MLLFLSVAGMLALAFALHVFLDRRRAGRRCEFIEGYVFPPGIRSKVRRRYPHLGDDDLARVETGLRQYFQLSLLARRRALAMPSQVVDVAWHEFILHTRLYRAFCGKAVGRFLHHTPAEAMRTPTEAQEGIRRAWRLACGLEGIDPRTPTRLPVLFALDDLLKIPDGFRYARNCLAATAPGSSVTYCGSHIGCGGGGGDGGCNSDSGCSGDGGGCGGGD